MRSQQGCSSILSLRDKSICIGMLTAVLWLPFAYLSAVSFDNMRYVKNEFSSILISLNFSMLICCSQCSATSLLMIRGVVKKNAGYMFPWLAIHFVIIIIGMTASLSLVISILMDYTEIQTIGPVMGIAMLILSALIFMWSAVYQHYKNLNSKVPVQLTCVNEEKILKVPSEPENPYHPVYSEH